MKTRMSFEDIHGTEPVVANAAGIELVKLLNWYYQTASADDRVLWLQEYGKTVLKYDEREMRALTSAANDMSNTTSSLARAIMHGSTFVEAPRIVSMIKADCDDAILNASKDSEQLSSRMQLLRQKIDMEEDRKASQVYWSLEDQVDNVAENGKAHSVDVSVLNNVGLNAKQIEQLKGAFLSQIGEFRDAIRDPEGYEHLFPKKAIKFLTAVVTSLDQSRVVVKTVRRVRKIRTAKPDKIVSKIKFLNEYADMKSVPPINILSSNILYAYDTKTRYLIRAKAVDGNHLTVKGGRIIGNVLKKTLRKPDDVLQTVRHSSDRKIERVWNSLSTKETPHSGLMNSRCLLVRAMVA